MISSWPLYDEGWNFEQDEKAIETIKEAVRGIRNLRAQRNVAPSRKVKVYVVSDKEETLQIFRKAQLFFESLACASLSSCQMNRDGIDEKALSIVTPEATLYIPLEDLVDLAAEKERLKREQERLQKELDRSKKMLSNERFLAKAPESKIAEEKEKQRKYEQTYAQVCERLAQIEK